MSNPSPNQKRNLKPTVSAGAYSASPSQLTLSTDQLSTNSLNQVNQNPYQPYGYGHDPSAFTFQPQPQQQYRQQIPQTLKSDYHPPPFQQQHQQLPSPTAQRKRGYSETLDNNVVPSSANSTLGGYGDPHGPFSTGPAGQVDLSLPSTQTLASPSVPKKGRTNTPWTPAEEQRLKTLRDAGSSWSEIAKTFPLRTEGSVKKHWYKDMHYAEFAEDESAALLQAIKDYENNKWKVIGQKVGKPAKACEQFAKEQGWKV